MPTLLSILASCSGFHWMYSAGQPADMYGVHCDQVYSAVAARCGQCCAWMYVCSSCGGGAPCCTSTSLHMLSREAWCCTCNDMQLLLDAWHCTTMTYSAVMCVPAVLVKQSRVARALKRCTEITYPAALITSCLVLHRHQYTQLHPVLLCCACKHTPATAVACSVIDMDQLS
jgi:hypothetical protein